MPFIDTSTLEVIERLPGWYGRYFHSPSMTFAHYDFKGGSSIHEHFHPEEPTRAKTATKKKMTGKATTATRSEHPLYSPSAFLGNRSEADFWTLAPNF